MGLVFSPEPEFRVHSILREQLMASLPSRIILDLKKMRASFAISDITNIIVLSQRDAFEGSRAAYRSFLSKLLETTSTALCIPAEALRAELQDPDVLKCTQYWFGVAEFEQLLSVMVLKGGALNTDKWMAHLYATSGLRLEKKKVETGVDNVSWKQLTEQLVEQTQETFERLQQAVQKDFNDLHEQNKTHALLEEILRRQAELSPPDPRVVWDPSRFRPDPPDGSAVRVRQRGLARLVLREALFLGGDSAAQAERSAYSQLALSSLSPDSFKKLVQREQRGLPKPPKRWRETWLARCLSLLHGAPLKRLTGLLPDDLWPAVKALIKPRDPQGKRGRPPKTDPRLVVDALLFMIKHRLKPRKLPSRFPPHATLYRIVQRWRQQGLLQKIQLLLEKQGVVLPVDLNSVIKSPKNTGDKS